MSDDETGVRRGDRQRPPGRERSARHRSEQRPSERARRTDPARLTAYTAMREIADGAYANLALPRLLRDKRISGRDAGFATELVYGATRMSGLYDADHRLGGRTPRRQDRRQRARHPAARGPPGARHAGGHPRRRRRDRGPRATGQRGRGRRLRQRRHAAHQRARARRVGRARVTRASPTRSSGSPCAPRTPCGWPGPCAPPSSATAPPRPTTSRRRSTALLEVDNEPAKVSLVARPGLCVARRARGVRGRAHRPQPGGRRPARGRSRRRRRGARRPGRRAGRGVPAARARAGGCRRRGRGRRPTSAGSTSAPARAARRACSRPSPSSDESPSWPTRSASTVPTSSGRR